VLQLLAALGASSNEADESEEDWNAAEPSLLPWLERHVPVARHALQEFQALDREEALYRHVLASSRVGVSFKALDQWTKKERCASIAAVVRLADALRETATALAGCRVLLCKGAGPAAGVADCMGRLVLDPSHSPEQWAASIDEATLSALHQRKLQMSERIKLESDAAAALGVRLVTGETEELIASTEYCARLAQVIEGPPTFATGRDVFPELSVLLMRSQLLPSPRSDMLYADMADPDLYSTIARLPIAQLQKELRVRAMLEEQESQSRVFLKRKLRVAGLLRASTVSLDQSRACQQKLSVAGITHLCAGLYVRIDSVFGVDDDGTLAVAWNCQ
jgi:hypothetical protein